MRAPFRRSVPGHWDVIEEILAVALQDLGIETIGLDNAVGRSLAADLVAPRALPPWDNSQMDGYAVNVGDLGSGALRVVPPIAAGQAATALVRGTAAPIMTGAPMPQGANTVVPWRRQTPIVFPPPRKLLADSQWSCRIPARWTTTCVPAEATSPKVRWS